MLFIDNRKKITISIPIAAKKSIPVKSGSQLFSQLQAHVEVTASSTYTVLSNYIRKGYQ